MGKITAAARERLLGQKSKMGSRMIIDNKTFSEGVFYLLARPGEVPGTEYLGVFYRTKRFGTTSPRTFGLDCPLYDYVSNHNKTASKEEREALYNAIQVEKREFWIPVIPAKEPGTAEAPNIKIFRATGRLYEAIANRLMSTAFDEEDFTALSDTARPVVITKTGSQTDTKWEIGFKDREPVSDDEAYMAKLGEIMENFDMSKKFYRVDWEKIEQIYVDLVGEPMPEHYKEQVGADAGGGAEDGAEDHDGSKPAAGASRPGTVVKKTAPAQPKAPQPDANGVLLGVTRVTFNDGTSDVEGLVKAYDAGAGQYDVDVEGTLWTVGPDDFTILEDAAEDPDAAAQDEGVTDAAADEPAADDAAPETQPEPEPEPVRRAPAPRKPATAPAAAKEAGPPARTAAKPAAAASTAKPPVRPASAKTAPAKAAPAPAAKATAAAPGALRKPAPAAAKGGAATSIRDRLSKGK